MSVVWDDGPDPAEVAFWEREMATERAAVLSFRVGIPIRITSGTGLHREAGRWLLSIDLAGWAWSHWIRYRRVPTGA